MTHYFILLILPAYFSSEEAEGCELYILQAYMGLIIHAGD